MHKIDILAFKANTFDSEDFANALMAYNSNCIILTMDLDKMTVVHKAPHVKLKKNIFKFHKIKNSKINDLFLPFLFLFDIILIIRILAGICFRYRPRICWIENVYAAFIIGLLKIFNGYGELIYLPGDWLVNAAHKTPRSYIANNMLFPLLDYFVCRFSDVVVYSDERLAQARFKFWGRKIPKREKIYSALYFPGMRLKVNNREGEKNAICFLGDMRLDSGLDIAIKVLRDLRKEKDIVIKIIGRKGQNFGYFWKMAKDYGLDPYVEFLGFVKTENLMEAAADCFCGINILTSINSFSNYAIPGKQMHYLQLLLPIIATENAGTLVTVIREKSLGLIIEPSAEAFREAVLKIHRDQVMYRKNIMDFVNNLKFIPIKEFIEI